MSFTEGQGAPRPEEQDQEQSLIERAAALMAQTPAAASAAAAPPPQDFPSRPWPVQDAPRRQLHLDPARLERSGLVGPATSGSLGDEFRIIGHQLRHRTAARSGRARSVMVTSSAAAEGKTFVSLNLALGLARDPELEVVLVDADLRRPSVALRLGLGDEDTGPGLRGFLADPKLAAADVLLATDRPNLFLLPGGGATGRDADLQVGSRLRALVEGLSASRRERIVLFDTAPVLAVSTPHLLAPLVDQVVVVVAAEETAKTMVDETLRRLGDHAAKVHLVLNKCRSGFGTDPFAQTAYGYHGGD